MRAAILSDIHSNLPALQAVLHKVEELQISTLWCLGDIVGYGAFPNECIEIIRSRCSLVVAGNHDSGVIGTTSIENFNERAVSVIWWTRRELTAENLLYLEGLPLLLTHKSCTLVHASPSEPSAWRYVFSARLAEPEFRAFATRLCFIGHTHSPLIIAEDGSTKTATSDGRFVVNVGSVGQPRDGNPMAGFCIFDSTTGLFEIVRVPYAIEEAADAIRKAGLPESLARRLYHGT
jgi:diadenosine tetraphosphatase ApaH/serine/threonine PP2A family protein phosphatase